MSSVTNVMERDLYYNKIILHFQPDGGGWSFRSAWVDHLPMTRGALEARMPCFRDALTEVANAPARAIDPTIASQTQVPHQAGMNFGVPFLWLIFILGAALLVFVAVPTRRKFTARRMEMKDRPFRKPGVIGLRFRRKRVEPRSAEL